MAKLLRKVKSSIRFQSLCDSDSSERNRLSSSSPSSLLSLGAFDQIPSNILMQILKLLGPKEATKMSAVSKYWNSLVSDNQLWIFFIQNGDDSSESIFFAKINLGSRYPLQALSGQLPQLSFMNIYSQRMQIPGSIIIDGGSGCCKFG